MSCEFEQKLLDMKDDKEGQKGESLNHVIAHPPSMSCIHTLRLPHFSDSSPTAMQGRSNGSWFDGPTGGSQKHGTAVD